MKGIFAVLALVALFVGYTYINTNAKNPPVPTTQKEQPSENTNKLKLKEDGDPLTVEYVGGEFFPKTTTIKQGETVTFINRSNKSMWVASDNHPLHKDYPEFDQKGLVKENETYSFTFDRVGTWKYHDHINPRAIGTIIVE